MTKQILKIFVSNKEQRNTTFSPITYIDYKQKIAIVPVRVRPGFDLTEAGIGKSIIEMKEQEGETRPR